MLHSIDTFSTFAGAAVVVGWSSRYAPGTDVMLLHKGTPMQTVVRPVERWDVASVHGEAANLWGFRIYGICDCDPDAADIRLLINGEDVTLLDCADENDLAARDLFHSFAREVSAKGGRLLEIGSRARSGTTYRQLFGPSVSHVGLDIREGENVDVVGDAHAMSGLIDPVDFIFSISTFEHLLMPWKVAIEMNKVLRMGGRAFCHSHQTWPPHEQPWDYMRFSRDAWSAIFNAHTGFRVVEARQGEQVAVVSTQGNHAGMDRHRGYALSACIVEKVAEPIVEWRASVSDLMPVNYSH